MKTSDFDYVLPADLIAQEPADPRDASRLMLLHRDAPAVEHHHFRDLPRLLRPGDLLVANDTRVMAARLHGVREDTGGRVEALLVEQLSPVRWKTLFRPARAAIGGRSFAFETHSGTVLATPAGRDDDAVILDFAQPLDPASAGDVPFPPYIKHFGGDPERYQTVYGRDPKSSAAPTAGLHFTPELIVRLRESGIEMSFVTLEVGPGTFKPVTADDPRDHQLHAEHVTVSGSTAAAITSAKDDGRRVIAVGTTVVRTLEHVAREASGIVEWAGNTSLRILPGDPFLVVDGMITNFHLPRSTLLMLICAFAGYDTAMHAYRTAVNDRYRFYSFGDAMLILP